MSITLHVITCNYITFTGVALQCHESLCKYIKADLQHIKSQNSLFALDNVGQ